MVKRPNRIGAAPFFTLKRYRCKRSVVLMMISPVDCARRGQKHWCGMDATNFCGTENLKTPLAFKKWVENLAVLCPSGSIEVRSVSTERLVAVLRFEPDRAGPDRNTIFHGLEVDHFCHFCTQCLMLVCSFEDRCHSVLWLLRVASMLETLSDSLWYCELIVYAWHELMKWLSWTCFTSFWSFKLLENKAEMKGLAHMGLPRGFRVLIILRRSCLVGLQYLQMLFDMQQFQACWDQYLVKLISNSISGSICVAMIVSRGNMNLPLARSDSLQFFYAWVPFDCSWLSAPWLWRQIQYCLHDSKVSIGNVVHVLQGKIACANVLSDLYAMGVTNCDNMLMILAASKKFTAKEREVVMRMLIKGFRVWNYLIGPVEDADILFCRIVQ